jgi:hypothetical protein
LVLRAYQVGGELNGVTYAPAQDVFMEVEIVPVGAPNAPLTFSQWQVGHSISGSKTQDSDRDGASDFEEYAGGTDPNDAASRPVYTLTAGPGGEAFVLEIDLSRLAPVRVAIEESRALSAAGGWEPLIPEIETIKIQGENAELRKLRLRLPGEGSQQFWRAVFEQAE